MKKMKFTTTAANMLLFQLIVTLALCLPVFSSVLPAHSMLPPEPLHILANNKLPALVLEQVIEHSNNITIKWKVKGEASAYGFRVYRRNSLKGAYETHRVKGGFTQIKKEWFLVVNDTDVTPLAMYEYQAVALDKSGNEGQRSAPVKARGRAEDVLPYFTSTHGHSEADGEVVISWQLQMKAMARSINIYRSAHFDKDFNLVGRAAAEDTVFTDQTVTPNENQYYQLEVLMDEGSRKSPVISVLGKSNLKPEPPQITSIVSKNGLVTLQWTPQAGQINGYYIYSLPSIGAEPLQVSHMIAPDSSIFTYKATTNGNQYAVYYTMKTVGADYALSDAALPVEVMLNGLSKIEAPAHFEANATNEKIILTWDEQFSANDNIAGYTLFRKSKGQGFSQLMMDSLDPRRSIFEDILPTTAIEYTYRIVVRDYFGASAFAETTIITPGINIIPPEKVILSQMGSGILLSWGSTLQPIQNVVIYGYPSGQKPAKLQELEANETSWFHAQPSKGRVWNYFICYKDKNGKESAPSPVRFIKTK